MAKFALQQLATCQHWVFDMDGTLTVDAHDFEYVRRQLGLASGSDILFELAKLADPTEAAEKLQWLEDYETKVAASSQPADGVLALLTELKHQGASLAVVTRNTRPLAEVTLAAIGVEHLFAPELIFGRDCAPPKPDPHLLYQLAKQWQITAEQLVVVGDFHFDLRFAQAANACAVLVNTPSNLWPELTDFYFPSLRLLQQSLSNPVNS